MTAIRRQDGAGSEQSRYYLPNEAGSAERPNYIVQGHWGIENRLRRTLDVARNEDQARNRKGRCAENPAPLRKLALNLARLEASKGSVRGQLKRAGWDDGYRISIRSNSPKSICDSPARGRRRY